MTEEPELADLIRQEHEGIKRRLIALGVLVNDPTSDEELVRVVARHHAAFRTWKEHPDVQRNLRTDEKLGEASRRVFRVKVAEALDLVDELLDYVSKISKGNPLLARAFRDTAVPHLKSARQSLAAIPLKSSRLNTTTAARLTPLGKSFASNPTSAARQELTTFLATACKVGTREADRRTALIGNELGWWKVNIDDEWIPIEDRRGARGSAAIRKSRVRSQRRDSTKKGR